MRILQGTKVVEAPADWRKHIEADGRPVVIDLGAGDGRYAYESARADPSSLYIAVDPDAETLADYAYRAARKPARGGVENARFVVAPVEALPAELLGLATRVRVNFPWGSLLRGLLEPDSEVLRRVARLLKPLPPAPSPLSVRGSKNSEGVDESGIEIVMSYDPEHDTNAFAGESLPRLDGSYVESTLVPAYEAGGFVVTQQRQLTQDEALALPSTWGRRLLHARPRDVYFLACVPATSR